MKLYAFDTETHLIQPGLATPPLVCASVATDGEAPRLLDKKQADSVFKDLVTNHGLIGANVVYDLAVMAARDPELIPLIFKAIEDGRVHSTDLLEALHDNAKGDLGKDPLTGKPTGYALAFLEQRYFKKDRSAEKTNGWRKKYALLENVPLSEWPKDAIDYPLADAQGTLEVGKVQLLPDRANLVCHQDEMKAAWFLKLSSVWGMRTDPIMVEKVTADITRHHEASRRAFFDAGIVRVRPCAKKKGVLEKADAISEEWLDNAKTRIEGIGEDWVARRLVDIEKAKAKLKRGGFIRFANDTKRLKALVQQAYQGDEPKTKTAKVSTSRDTLEQSGNKLLEDLGEAGPNEKLFTTYVAVLRQGTRIPINPEVNSIVKTQRTSYRRPNLQQLPRGGAVRECFVPRRGYVYCSVDYAALELCTLSQVNNWLFERSKMMEAINSGQDLHTRLAARIAGITYERAMELRKAKDPLIVNLRQVSKPVNFGIPGLMGAVKLVYTARKDGVVFCELSGRSKDCFQNKRLIEYGKWAKKRPIAPTCEVCLNLAEDYIELFYSEWAEMRDYHKWTVSLAKRCDEDGVPIESWGSGMLRLEGNPNAVSNHFFQNLAAQGAKHAGWTLAKEIYTDKKSVLYGNGRIVVFVHDEIIMELREEVAHECAMRQAEIMVSAMKEYTPDVKISAEPALMRRWFKGGEKALDKKGRLKPWWPKDWTWQQDQEAMAKDLTA